MTKLKGKRVLVYGMGTSGQAACKLLHSKGACVSIYDDEDKFCASFNFDKNPEQHHYDLVVVSPGIKVIGNSLISHFLICKTPILSEIDLAYLFCKGKIVAITGTNGKTTVTSLVGKIFKEAGKQTFVCGNIGLPFSSVCEQGGKDSVYVIEVSNFQLELSSVFKSDIACILNIAPDHLDRHGSMEEYVRVKRKILTGKSNQKAILNFDDEYSKLSIINKKTTFFSKFLLKKGVFLKNNCIFCNKTKIMSVASVPLLGEKNLENVLASVAICAAAKIKPKFIRAAISTFKPPSHRLEYLGKFAGALVYDDSKATNIPSVEAALSALDGCNIVILMGGRNKDLNFDGFFAKNPSILLVLAFGEAGGEIAKSAASFGYDVLQFERLFDACQYAKSIANEHLTILLSPGCSSFDEFASYAVRGQCFKEYIFDK